MGDGPRECLLGLGEGTPIQRDVFAQAVAARLNHRDQHVDDQLRAFEIRWGGRDVNRDELQKDKDVVAEDLLHWRGLQVGDFFGEFVGISHCATVPRLETPPL